MARSAIIVPIWGLPPGLEDIRDREVEVARRGVPPHVTLLSPFMNIEAIDDAVEDRLRQIALFEPAFDVWFSRVGRWPPSSLGPGAVWLAPEPAEPFVRLTRAIWAAFPAWPPYGRADDPLEAHLTIAIDDPSRFDAVVRDAEPFLPFEERVDGMSLIFEDPAAGWRERARFPLG